MNARRAACLAPALLAVLLYLPTLGHAFVFDDRGVILENPLLQHLSDLPKVLAAPYWNTPRLPRGLYRPATSLSFGVDRALARGFRPSWFHGVNVLLHALATWLVTLLAWRVFRAPWPAFLAGLGFAVHPIHAEAVANVVGRSEILAACGALAAILCHLRAREDGAPRWLLLAAPAAALLAMLSKESGFAAPILCAVADAAFPVAPSGRSRRRRLYAGYGVAAVLALGMRAAALGTLGTGQPIAFVDNPAASAGPFIGRWTALACVTRYLGLLIWPRHLSADYSYDQIPMARGLLDPFALAGLAIAIGLVAGGAFLLRRRPTAAFALLFTACSFALTSNLFVFIGTLFAERLLYLPSAGLCLLFGVAVGAATPGRAARVALGAGIAACALLGWRTSIRVPDWKDDLSLYESAARMSPRSARIRYNLGNAYLGLRHNAEAEAQYRAALAIYDDFADASANLGLALLQEGRPREALAPLVRAAERLPHNPEVAVNLGTAYRMLGSRADAEQQFRKALEIDPGSGSAWNNLGALQLGRGDAASASASLGQAVAVQPAFALYRVNLADALMAAGRKDEAFSEFAAAHRLEPNLPEARRGMGEMALDRGDRRGAEEEFRAALEGDPPSARAANFLGYLMAQKGDARGAAGAYERALALDPSLYDAHRSLGVLYANILGDNAKAAEHLRRSLELAPDQPGSGELKLLLSKVGG